MPFLFGAASVVVAALAIAGSTPFLQAQAHPSTTSGTRQASPSPAESDLDRFMERVLARREVNRKVLNDYVLDETETFEILGPGRAPLSRTHREFTWYVRDGMHVRSPTRFNGVGVGDEARDEYERKWIRRERERQEKTREQKKTASGTERPPGLPTEPRFVSEAYFMDFKFEPGNYLLASRETFEGHEVLRIEYYPTRLFSDDDKDREADTAGERQRNRREREDERQIERRMNKTALVTLWIDPREHQIVRYTFDNVWLDFLPGAWLVRVDDIRASMTMGQPFPGVWLPREIHVSGGATLASGSFDIALSRVFEHYREANVETKVKVPGVARSRADEPASQGEIVATSPREGPAHTHHGPSLINEDEQSQSPAEVIRQIRVHGNTFLTDQDVLRIAGIAPGDALEPDTVTTVEKRLKDSGRFESVEVRKRSRSLADPTDISLVLVVHERPGVRSADVSSNPITGAFGRLRSQLLFLPILSYADGYGFTYGARFGTVDLLGAGERLSVPLTWGGTKRAALEFERAFRRGPLTRVTSSIGIWNRENPRFRLDDQRVELRVGAERELAHVVNVRLDASRSQVEFGALDEAQWTIGTSAALDTRADPAFPANAIYVGGGWTGLHVRDRTRINRYIGDARGYLRIIGQHVLAARVQYYTSDAPLPPYERLLLGGASTLRGFRAGSFDGDRMLVTSAELRVPITSVLSGSKLGLTLFTDIAKTADHGTSLDDARWHRGAGAGLFFIASVVKLNLNVAHGFDGGTRVHLASGFAF